MADRPATKPSPGTGESRIDRDDADPGGDAGRQRLESDRPAADAERNEQERRKGTIVSIEDLVGARVVARDGASPGSVVDVLASPPPTLEIQGLIVGKRSWLERLRIAARLRGHFPEVAKVDVVGWQDVERWDGLTVTIRPDASVLEVDLESGLTARAKPGRTPERGTPGEAAADEPERGTPAEAAGDGPNSGRTNGQPGSR